jgi:diaminopropionate ammonia-lyase
VAERALPFFSRPEARAWRCKPVPPEVRAFHASLPEYAPTPLVELPALARELGVGRVFLKDESSRLGLPAFKALGATWAVHRALAARGSASGGPVTLVCATDGNHGRAVARTARLLGHRAVVFMAPGVHPAATQAIADEGAEVVQGATSYDDAVAKAAVRAESQGAILVQDMGWPGYEEIPAWIVEGYATLCAEADDQLRDAGAGAPDLVVVPVGVGSFAQAVVTHYRSRADGAAPAILAVEPTVAACVLESLRRDELTTVDTADTVMAGLNCGTPSGLGWPVLRAGLDAAVAVDDVEDLRAVRDLAALGVAAGPCGAATLAGLRAALSGQGAQERRAALGLGPDSVVVLLSTEGAAANPHAARAATTG